MPPILNELCVQPDQVGENPGQLDVIDGQQRSFALRTIVAWALVRGAEENPTGEMDQTLFHLLMRPRAGRTEGHDWIQRVNFDQGLAKGDTWTDVRGRQHGAMGHLLAALSRGPDSTGLAAATDMKARLEREIRSRFGKSSQATAIHQVFKYMDGLLQTLVDRSVDGTRAEIVDVLALSTLRSLVNVRILHPNINAEQYLRNQNTTGVNMSDADSLKTLLIEASERNEMVARHTNQLKLLADQNAKGNNPDDLKLLTYAVALALSTKNLTPIGLVSSTNKIQPYIERLLLDHPNDAAKTAKAIAARLPEAFEAVLLLRTKRADTNLCSKLSEPLRAAMQLHAKLGVRSFTPALAWMALTNPEEAIKSINFVNLNNAHNHIVSSILPNLERRAHERKGTERMDVAAAKWGAQNKVGQKSSSYTESLKNLLINGDRPPAFAANEDVIGAVAKLAASEKGERTVLMLKKNSTVMSPIDSAALQVILGVTEKDIQKGVELLSGPTVLGTFVGQTHGVTIAKKPVQIDIGVRTTIRQIEARRKSVWDDVGGEPDRPNIKTNAQRAVENQRYQRRVTFVRQLLEQARKDGLQESTITSMKTQASMLAAGVVNDAVFEYICVRRQKVNDFYKSHFHSKSAKDQMKIAKVEIPAAIIPRKQDGAPKGNSTIKNGRKTP
jgi:hypothetical protein